MTTRSFDTLGAQLVRAWLSALNPPSDLWKVFPGFDPLPGMAGANDGTNDSLGDSAHLQQFAEVLRVFAEWYGAKRKQPLEMSAAIVALLSNLQAQLRALHAVTREDIVPLMTWLEAQTHPILGPGREAHRRWAAVARAGIAQARALQALQASHMEILDEALTRCSDRLGSDQEPALTSVRGLYDFWVRCADSTYREFAFATTYATQFAAVVDSGSGMRQAWRRWQAANFEILDLVPGETAPRAAVSRGVENAAPITKKPRSAPTSSPVDDRPARKAAKRPAPKRAAPLEFDIGQVTRPAKVG